MSRKSSCPICTSSKLYDFLQRKAVPVHQNLVFSLREDALKVKNGELVFSLCRECGFIFNRAFDSKLLSYGEAYDNTQSSSSYFKSYMHQLAENLLKEQGVRNSRIVEVGCGRGEFLRLLVENHEYGNTGFGFDPSYTGPESDSDGRLLFKKSFYDKKCADIPADVVVCRHVIEHHPEPLELLNVIRCALNNKQTARVYFETPDAEWILKNQVVWDFFYEHCSLFSRASLRGVFESAGFTVQDVRSVFGGQYLWLEANLVNKLAGVSRDAGGLFELSCQFAKAEEERCADWRRRITGLKSSGKIAVWGAGAKGTTFVNLIDPQRSFIDCLVDLNPNKQGKFVPGSAHPIVGVDALFRRGVRSAILMNSNYRNEIQDLLAAAGLNIQLVE